MEVALIDSCLDKIFGKKYHNRAYLNIVTNNEFIRLLNDIEASLPALRPVEPHKEMTGHYTTEFKYWDKAMIGQILVGFFKVTISHMSHRLLIYLNRTGQLTTPFIRVINYMVSHEYDNDLFKDWASYIMKETKADTEVFNLAGNIVFQLFRAGVRFIHAKGDQFILDSDTMEPNLMLIHTHLQKYGLTCEIKPMPDTLFLSRDKFVILGTNYEAKGIQKITKHG